MLRVDDADRSLEFYRDDLGFEVAQELHEDGRPVSAYLARGRASIMLTERRGDVEVIPGHGAILYLYAEDAAAVRGGLAARGHEVSPLRHTVYEMLEFDVLDPDGYELWFGQATGEGA